MIWAVFCLSWLVRIFFPPSVPYEFLRPADQISTIQTARIMDDIDLYLYSIPEINTMLEDATFTISTLKPENHAAFLECFASVPHHTWVNDPIPHLRGKALLITYQDGSREWICADGTFYQDNTTLKSGMTWSYFDDSAFSGMLDACKQFVR